ncbi:hypothetical protein EDC19_1397 [Natranaerovirga hydrolytica]|uniref:Uncharacterized protein n=1 Tax=Natranaerovirga hydrolytica TaxID=680378 RepID=A0A4R1MKF6_9FIRM|nr:hypothetical protein [Natranaerovirga hydrolytica]TCK93206.1 hypothetical protein EDC19_1397 [Natranaerovirga hydrolytica]
MKKLLGLIVVLIITLLSSCINGLTGEETFSEGNKEEIKIVSNKSNQQINEELNITSSNSTGNDKESDTNRGSDFSSEDIDIINDYSYLVELENWGEVQFISILDKNEFNIRKVRFALCDNDKNIIYNLPKFYGNKWVFSEIDSVVFQDINKDGSKDIVIIAYFIRGHGNNAASEFPVVGVYFQKNNEFIVYPDLNEELNVDNQNIDKKKIIAHLEEIDLSEYDFTI